MTVTDGITGQVERYRSGAITWAELLDDLGTRRYATPQRATAANRPGDPDRFVEFIDTQDFDEDGTIDELKKCRYSTLLTAGEYAAIIGRLWPPTGLGERRR